MHVDHRRGRGTEGVHSVRPAGRGQLGHPADGGKRVEDDRAGVQGHRQGRGGELGRGARDHQGPDVHRHHRHRGSRQRRGMLIIL